MANMLNVESLLLVLKLMTNNLLKYSSVFLYLCISCMAVPLFYAYISKKKCGPHIRACSLNMGGGAGGFSGGAAYFFASFEGGAAQFFARLVGGGRLCFARKPLN